MRLHLAADNPIQESKESFSQINKTADIDRSKANLQYRGSTPESLSSQLVGLIARRPSRIRVEFSDLERDAAQSKDLSDEKLEGLGYRLASSKVAPLSKAICKPEMGPQQQQETGVKQITNSNDSVSSTHLSIAPRLKNEMDPIREHQPHCSYHQQVRALKPSCQKHPSATKLQATEPTSFNLLHHNTSHQHYKLNKAIARHHQNLQQQHYESSSVSQMLARQRRQEAPLFRLAPQINLTSADLLVTSGQPTVLLNSKRPRAELKATKLDLVEPKRGKTIKFISQLYFLIHLSVILSLVLHHKFLLNDEQQHLTSQVEFHLAHLKSHSYYPSNDSSLFPNDFLNSSKPKHANQRRLFEPNFAFPPQAHHTSQPDVFVRLFGYKQARQIIHYVLCYLLSSSLLILICLRLLRPSCYSQREQLVVQQSPKSYYQRTNLDCTPVLLGSICLGVFQLIAIGLDIANKADWGERANQSHWLIYLAALEFAFVSMLMQYILGRVIEKHRRRRRAETSRFAGSQKLGGFDTSTSAFLAMRDRLATSGSSSASLASATSSVAGRSAGNSLSEGLQNIALAHLLVTHSLIWLMELNSISLLQPMVQHQQYLQVQQIHHSNDHHHFHLNHSNQQNSNQQVPNKVLSSSLPSLVRQPPVQPQIYTLASQNNNGLPLQVREDSQQQQQPSPPLIRADSIPTRQLVTTVTNSSARANQTGPESLLVFEPHVTSVPKDPIGQVGKPMQQQEPDKDRQPQVVRLNEQQVNVSLPTDSKNIVRRKSPKADWMFAANETLVEPAGKTLSKVALENSSSSFKSVPFFSTPENSVNPNDWHDVNVAPLVEPNLQLSGDSIGRSTHFQRPPSKLEAPPYANPVPVRPVGIHLMPANRTGPASTTQAPFEEPVLQAPPAADQQARPQPARSTPGSPARRHTAFKQQSPSSSLSLSQLNRKFKSSPTRQLVKQQGQVDEPRAQFSSDDILSATPTRQPAFPSMEPTLGETRWQARERARSIPRPVSSTSQRPDSVNPITSGSGSIKSSVEAHPSLPPPPPPPPPPPTSEQDEKADGEQVVESDSGEPSEEPEVDLDSLLPPVPNYGNETETDENNIEEPQPEEPPEEPERERRRKVSRSEPELNIARVIKLPHASKSKKTQPSKHVQEPLKEREELEGRRSRARRGKRPAEERVEREPEGEGNDEDTTSSVFNEAASEPRAARFKLEASVEEFPNEKQAWTVNAQEQRGSGGLADFLVPIVQQYQILLLAILLNLWLDRLSGLGKQKCEPIANSKTRAKQHQVEPRFHRSPISSGDFLLQNRGSPLISELAHDDLSLGNLRHRELEDLQRRAAAIAMQQANELAIKERSRSRPNQVNLGQSSPLSQTPSSSSSSLDDELAGSERLLYTRHLSPRNRPIARELHKRSANHSAQQHLYASSLPNELTYGSFRRKPTSRSLRNRPDDELNGPTSSTCSIFFGTIVASVTLVATLANIELVSMLNQCAIQLASILVCLLGLCLIWRSNDSNRKHVGPSSEAKGESLNIHPSDYQKRLWQRKSHLYLAAYENSARQAGIAANRKSNADNRYEREPKHRQCFHYLFLLAAYYSGVCIALNLGKQYSVNRMFSQQVVHFLSGSHSNLSTTSYLHSSEPLDLATSVSLGQKEAAHYQALFHFLLAAKGLLLILQVTIQTCLIRCSFRSQSSRLRQVYTFLMFANLSLWTMELCLERPHEGSTVRSFDTQQNQQQQPIALQQVLDADTKQTFKTASFDQQQARLVSLESLTSFSDSLVTLSHLYHGLVFI